MDRCTNKNNNHLLAEIQEESLNTIQNTIYNSLENTQANFNKGFQLKRKLKSHKTGIRDISPEIIQYQRQDDFNDNVSKYIEIAIPNQNGLLKRQTKRQKQKMICDQVRKSIIKNIYCSNQQEQFFKQYIQQQNGPIQQQQIQQYNINSPAQLQINGQERYSTQSSYQQSASTSASTSYNSYIPKKYHNQNSINLSNMQHQYAKQIDQSYNYNNGQNHLRGVSPIYNRNSPGSSTINTQTLIKYIQKDNPEELEVPKRMQNNNQFKSFFKERKMQYIERFSSATVYMGKGSNSVNTSNLIKQGYLPPVKNQTNKSIDRIDTFHGYTQPDSYQFQQGSFSSLSNNESYLHNHGKQYERSSSYERQGHQTSLVKLDKALIDFKEDELSEHIYQQEQKQKSIIQKQQQQLDQYRQLQQQSKQLEKENQMQSNINLKATGINASYNLIKLNKIEQPPEQQTYDCNPNQQKQSYYNALSKKQFEKFMKDKQKVIDERINSLKVTDKDKVQELKYLLEKQKATFDQTPTHFTFQDQQNNKFNAQRAHSSNVYNKSPKNVDFNLNNSNTSCINQNSINYYNNSYNNQNNRSINYEQEKQKNGQYIQNIQISNPNISFDNQYKEFNKRQNTFDNSQKIQNISVNSSLSNKTSLHQSAIQSNQNMSYIKQSVSFKYWDNDISKQNSYLSNQNSQIGNQNSYLNHSNKA